MKGIAAAIVVVAVGLPLQRPAGLRAQSILDGQPAPAVAVGGAMTIAQLQYEGGGDWYSNPSSMPNWMRGFEQRTGIITFHDEVQIRPGDDALYRYPIAYMNGHGNVKFTDEEAQYLRQWMQAGGFLWAEDNYGMDKSFRREAKRLFPDKELVDLPNNHPIFHSFYNLPGLPKIHEHDGGPPRAFGIPACRAASAASRPHRQGQDSYGLACN